MAYVAFQDAEKLPGTEVNILENECRDLFHLMNLIEQGLQRRLQRKNNNLPAPKVRTALQMMDAYTKSETFYIELMETIYTDLIADYVKREEQHK